MVIFDEEHQEAKIRELRRQEEEETVKIVSGKYNIPYLNLSAVPIDTDALKLVPEEKARKGELVVVQKIGKNLQVAVKNPKKPETQTVLEELRAERYNPSKLFLVSRFGLERAWELYKHLPEDLGMITGEITVSESRLEYYRNAITTPESVTPLIDAVAHKSVTELLELVIGGALKTGASDIHIEPQPDKIRLRYRLDGVLHDIAFLPTKTYKFILSRIKLVSGILLNIKEKGQDGRFTISAGGAEIEVRVSTLPGPDGENIVMRLLDPRTISLALENLGMQPWVEEQMKKELKKPNGMILTTGPTGSGKTTTLYAFLKKVYTPETKIITLENPIEYHLLGVEQTQIESRKGYDFASGLRSILRQDPDVILVGEIRDFETAETALHAALTGHLVFSTLHTNDASGTIPRLIDMGANPNIIAPAINVAMAQRLVRRLCLVCRLPHEPAPEEWQEIKKSVEDMPAGLPRPDMTAVKIFVPNPGGCAHCALGYRGRISVYEIILIDDDMEKLIKTSPAVAEIRSAMKRQGQITMKQDGVLKVLAGITDLGEVRRVMG